MTPADNENSAIGEKPMLRRMLRERRARFVADLSPSVRGIAFRVLPSPVLRRLPTVGVVSLYYPAEIEAPTAGIADQLEDLGYVLALPRMDRDTGAMQFAHWDREAILVPGPFRTLQPTPDAETVAPDIIIAPLLGFDSGLNRIGQGGGHFDRAFAAHPDAIRIGLGWSVQEVERVPVESYDKPLDMVVTERAVFEREQGTR
ncbi:MAG: 5-formyltetrahydrofolate cyclo-ligase [Sphingobium sp.]